ncbi:nucleotide exchange factor GrpE [Lentisphaera profundi]|uniref:Protein GrpE n=1 Tax=Lentisphaera profundi TaxID=1658616 RepID=A0ABY7VTE7_9BACT|nr:nucleotide exchange factor GrpE [Lentisphaera profundi]WDE96997.1 nucleotide exchange factor GrpE [Lentisphaera profundi]
MSEDTKDLNEEQLIDSVEATEENIIENEVIDEQTEATEVDSEENAEVVEEVEEPKTAEEIIADLELSSLRQRADFDNFRKRSIRDQDDARQRGKISVLEDVLPVYDTFKMAMQATQMENVNLDMIVQGMNMIQNMFVKAMDDMGVVDIDARDKKFDPNMHEATSESFSEDVKEGDVLSQTRCGYKLGERLLRPAMVVVSKGAEPEEVDEIIESEEA